MIKRDDFYVLLLLLLAFAMRMVDIDIPNHYFADESLKIPVSMNYPKTGHVEPDGFVHPPLRFILIYGTIKILGNNPYGWRMLFVIAGTATVFLLYLVGKQLFGSKIALLAALLLAMDPTHIRQSRTTVEEIVVALFFLLSFLAALRYFKGDNRYLALCGLGLGLSLAVKLYFLPALLVLMIGAIILNLKNGWRWQIAADIFAAFIIIPAVIFLLSYTPWFGRGYSFTDFFQMQIDAYRELQSITNENTNMGKVATEKPSEWFIKPLFYGFKYRSDGTWSEYHVDIANFPVWMLTIPSLVYMVRRAYRNRDRCEVLFLALFAVTYLQFLLTRRPIFIYSTIVLLPFVALSVSTFLTFLLERFANKDLMRRLLVFLLFLWCLYLYPLALGKQIPDSFYSPLISIGRIYNIQ